MAKMCKINKKFITVSISKTLFAYRLVLNLPTEYLLSKEIQIILFKLRQFCSKQKTKFSVSSNATFKFFDIHLPLDEVLQISQMNKMMRSNHKHFFFSMKMNLIQMSKKKTEKCSVRKFFYLVVFSDSSESDSIGSVLQ